MHVSFPTLIDKAVHDLQLLDTAAGRSTVRIEQITRIKCARGLGPQELKNRFVPHRAGATAHQRDRPVDLRGCIEIVDTWSHIAE